MRNQKSSILTAIMASDQETGNPFGTHSKAINMSIHTSRTGKHDNGSQMQILVKMKKHTVTFYSMFLFNLLKSFTICHHLKTGFNQDTRAEAHPARPLNPAEQQGRGNVKVRYSMRYGHRQGHRHSGAGTPGLREGLKAGQDPPCNVQSYRQL